MDESSSPAAPIRPWASLAIRDYRLVWIASVCNAVAIQIRNVAGLYQVYQISGSALQLGLTGFFQAFPFVIFGLFAGAVADAFDRKKLLVGTVAIQIIPSVLLGVLTLTGTIQVWHIFTLGFVGALVEVFNWPARSALIPRLVPPSYMMNAVTLNTIIIQTSFLLGPALGGVLIDRSPFLQRGLLPLAALASTVPLVGIAPIMVMWFGFDWPSKAAVVALVTFFPMLVNTLAGLSASGHVERDLMRCYAASYPQTLTRLYLPAALPFIFNALKINATLSLIGAIVAEFFGTPTQGIGFRISTEAGRMAIDMVWAEIALAALAGMAFYGFVTLAERATTFWHPSYRT
jgi:NitT/TauT family transport system permease protein